ncbi:MAG: TIGR03620 family F420-dependent LLM class oxidoreductase [Myxococcota bacterium]
MEQGALGGLGVWSWVDHLPPGELAALAGRLEAWGYSALWVPEAIGRNPFATHGFLAGRTRTLMLATGIANIYARDAMAMRSGAEAIQDLSEGRFALGIGVSHAPLVSAVRGHDYGKPVSTMRAYLEAMEKAPYPGAEARPSPPVLLAALRPRMLALAAESAQGAHPYNVTPEHTARAREILGQGVLLCPEQKLLLETDAAKARAVARQNLAVYISLPNYQNNWKWLGFDDADFADGGSDRLIDAMVCWGDEDALRARIQEHRDAGADHVCIQPLRPDGAPGPDERALELLAPAGA